MDYRTEKERGDTPVNSVTRDRVEQAIQAEYWFTAWDAIGPTAPRFDSLKLLTICVLVLDNGFVVTGESACAASENFDEALGKKLASLKARDKVRMLEGYLLKEGLHQAATVASGGSL